MKAMNKVLVLSLIIGASGTLSGCLVVAVPLIVKTLKSGHTATVEVKPPPEEVYAAMLRVVASTPDVELVKRDDAKHIVEAKRGKDRATGTAALQDNGYTKLTVTARAGEKGQDDKGLAKALIEKVCAELGVQYRVVEK